jgi:predicted RecA/RadA family phage recombinase
MVASHRVARTLALTVALSLATAGSAVATTKNGITPLAPKAGTSVPKGKAAVFRMKVANPGAGVFVNVCKSNRKNRDGVICQKTTILQAHKRKGAWEAKQKFFDFPAFWLNNPGTYYWQAYATVCSGSDCKLEGPVVRFKVK